MKPLGLYDFLEAELIEALNIKGVGWPVIFS